MSSLVLDASAVLAIFYEEPGAERVMEQLQKEGVVPLISSVNLSEVFARLLRDGMMETEAAGLLAGLKLQVIAFGEADAYHAGRLQRRYPTLGLSLGDRACLALAEDVGAPAWTGDQAWRKLKNEFAIEFIRA